MTITTVAQALANQTPPQQWLKSQAAVGADSGQLSSSWQYAGYPPRGANDTVTVGGTTLNSSSSGVIAGMIPFFDPSPGANTYVLEFTNIQTTLGALTTVMLADRLWHCGSNTSSKINTLSTATQTINSVAWPPRDANGTANGTGVYVAIEVAAAPSGGGPPSVSYTYTNANGFLVSTTNSISTLVTGTVPSTVAGTFCPFGQQEGLSGAFTGVQSVKDITISTPYTTTNGTWQLVAYRIICMIDASPSGFILSGDALTLGFPQMFNGSVPFILSRGTNTAYAMSGLVRYTQG